MNAIVTIAARSASSRLPGKALLPLSGEPLLKRLIERLGHSSCIQKIVLCTTNNPEDDLLCDVATSSDIPAVRGDELDVMSRFLDAASQFDADIVIRVTGDNPLTDPALMDQMIVYHRENSADYTYTADTPRGTRSEIISVDALKNCYQQLQDPASSEYMTYMLRRPDRLRVCDYKVPDRRLIAPDVRLTVDTQEDYELMKKIYDNFEGAPPPLAEVLAWLKKSDYLLKINGDVPESVMPEHYNVKFKGE